METYNGAGIALFKKTSEGYSILLGKRQNRPGIGKWSIFGGKREKYDKTSFENAKREFKEESRLSLESLNAKQVGECHLRFPFFKWDTFLYEVEEDFGIPSNYCDEFSDMRFILLKDLKKYKLAIGVRKEVRAFQKSSDTKER